MGATGGGTCSEGREYIKPLPFESLLSLKGKTITDVKKIIGDQGIILEFNDGTILDIGYSSCEGTMLLDNKEVNAEGIWNE